MTEDLPGRKVVNIFEAAFRVVSWSAWVPNLIFAEIWLRNTSPDGRWSSGGTSSSRA